MEHFPETLTSFYHILVHTQMKNQPRYQRKLLVKVTSGKHGPVAIFFFFFQNYIHLYDLQGFSTVGEAVTRTRATLARCELVFFFSAQQAKVVYHDPLTKKRRICVYYDQICFLLNSSTTN